MKKLLTVGIVLILLFAFCSCGSKAAEKKEEAPAPLASQSAVEQSPQKEETPEPAKNELGEIAKKYIGTAYKSGGKTPDGFDCSGLVLYCLNESGYDTKDLGSSHDLYLISEHISEKDIRPGDLVFFKGTYNTDKVSHVGIFLGEGKMIHAGTKEVEIVNLADKYWLDHFYAYGRIK